MTTSLVTADLSGVPLEELRLAVVLNGGVSLAVWMGGTTLEMDRLVHADRPGNEVYAAMLRLAGCTARVDVVAGTSAGGVNGAALALSQVNRAADLSALRDVWAEQGRLEALLRSPVKGAPSSVLRGDDHFLPQLNAALGRLADTTDPDDLAPAEDVPIDLTIMTTVLRGNQTVTVDALGQRLPQAVHGARFHWRRPVATGYGPDPFGCTRIRHTAAELALAARSSSSFPVAFEPSFVPVGAPETTSTPAALWPDMSDVVEDWGDPTATGDRSRFVVDGGVLANTPTKPALDAIAAMPAEGAVRRVLLLVYPHAPAPGVVPADERATPPALTRTLGGVLGALSAQGSRTFVDEISRFNAEAAARRGTRAEILAQVTPAGGGNRRAPSRRLEVLAGQLYEHYRHVRRTHAARSLAARVVGRLPASAWCDADEAWDLDRVRRAAERAQLVGLAAGPGGTGGVPYVPARMPTAVDPGPATGWAWGDAGALGVAEAANDVLRALSWALPGTREDDCQRVRDARRYVTTAIRELRRVRAEVDAVWSDPVLATLRPDDAYWRLRLASYARRVTGAPDELLAEALEEVVGREVARRSRLTRDDGAGRARGDEVRDAAGRLLWEGVAGGAGQTIRRHVDGVVVALSTKALPVLEAYCREHPLTGSDGRATPAAVLGNLRELHLWRALFTGAGRPSTTTELLTRLLQLQVVSTTLGDGAPTGLSIPIELVQLSAQTRNAFATFSRTADDKLGGWSLGRFGGFLKRSWRVNDWTWGRVDAATVLARTVLHPARVRRAAYLSGAMGPGADPGDVARATLDDIVVQLFPGATPAEDPRFRALHRRAVDELTEVLRPDVASEALPAMMPALADLFAWAVHLGFVAQEVVALASAVRQDRREGASRGSRGAVLLAAEKPLVKRLEAAAAAGEPVSGRDRVRAFEAFDRAGVGREELGGEVASDLLLRTASAAGAVTASVLDAPTSGLGPARPLTRVLRGAMLVIHWVVVGLTSRSAIPRSLALLGLSLGGVLVVASLFGALPQAWSAPAALIGTACLAAAFGFGALRTGTVVHGLVLLTPLVPLVTFAFTSPGSTSSAPTAVEPVSALRGGVTLVAVVALVLGLFVLGSLPQSLGSPWLALGRLADRQGVEHPDHDDLQPMARLVLGTRRRLLGVVRWLPSVLGPAVVVLVPVALAWGVAHAGTAVVARWFLGHAATALWVGVVSVLVGTCVAFRFGDLLRPLERALTRNGEEVTWRYGALRSAVAVNASWSVLYGLAYVALGTGLTHTVLAEDSPAWLVALVVTCFALGVLLAGLLPLAAPVLVLRALERSEDARDASVARFTVHDPAPSDGQDPTALARWTARRSYAVDLTERGLGYRWLVSPAAGTDGRAPSLRPRGVELLRRLDEARSPRPGPRWRRRLRRWGWRISALRGPDRPRRRPRPT